MATESGEPTGPDLAEGVPAAVARPNVSLKLSALTSHFEPAAPAATSRAVQARLLPLLRKARAAGVFVNIDMESSKHRALTLDLFQRLLMEPDLRDWEHVGIVLQAYLRSAEQDLAALLDWAGRRGTRLAIRLVKGAYWDSDTIRYRQRGWPVPLFEHKVETDANYEALVRTLLEANTVIRPAFGTHNLRTLAYVEAMSRLLVKWPRHRLTVRTASEEFEAEALFVLRGKFYAGPWMLHRDAHLGHGALRVLALPRALRRDVASLAARALMGMRAPRSDWRYLECDSLEVTSEQAVPVQADGDPVGLLPARVEMSGDAVRFR